MSALAIGGHQTELTEADEADAGLRDGLFPHQIAGLRVLLDVARCVAVITGSVEVSSLAG